MFLFVCILHMGNRQIRKNCNPNGISHYNWRWIKRIRLEKCTSSQSFIGLRPTPFPPENPDDATEVYFLYNDEGLYVGGYLHKEKTKDSITHELVGRDGFGANDFIGVIFDTYNDKLNGFEYFVTPLGEQMDARQAPNPNGESEDFGWNAVWGKAPAKFTLMVGPSKCLYPLFCHSFWKR